ncbi:cell division protein FtsQ/DivIB [Pseudoroseomonas cervicalis]|uniref:cell division protein FtsQ/DivIB n=1 Tax=Teichococcus cervicalis TaxID=204525 RepID=UPI0022F1D2B2|nr:cell division protein FtsQ/DivIB [Pseudoroseomonas cervicalis]WBV44207.1 cell division protein FtsQ/DivIB [Pseudoroseomonas cervicalis]
MARSARPRAEDRTRLSSDGARPRNAAPQRPSSLRLWLRRQRPLLRPALLGLAGLGVVGAGVVVVSAFDPAGRFSFVSENIAEIAGGAGLTVNEIIVRGQQNTPRELIRAAIGTRHGDPLLAFSPAQAKARLESIAWIESAEVQRNLSGNITVTITERKPFAIWQHNGEFAVVDRDGRVVSADTLDAFGPLPLLVGDGAHRLGAALYDALKQEPEVQRRVQALVLVGERRWNLRLHNGTDVLLPEAHEDVAVRRLAELQRSSALMDRPLAAIDLRLPDRLVVRQQPSPEPEPQRGQAPRRSGRG